MTDNEIIKALECCSTATCISNKCPLEKIQDIPKCTTKLTKNALDLINRQKAEIERLKKENHHFADIGKMYSEIKAEAIKEFAERLKEMSEHFWEEKENFVSEDDIDNLVKEMVGDENVD